MALTVHQEGMLRSSMSDGSCAAMLGRSQAWVARMRAELAAGDAGEAAPRAAEPEANPVRGEATPAPFIDQLVASAGERARQSYDSFAKELAEDLARDRQAIAAHLGPAARAALAMKLVANQGAAVGADSAPSEEVEKTDTGPGPCAQEVRSTVRPPRSSRPKADSAKQETRPEPRAPSPEPRAPSRRRGPMIGARQASIRLKPPTPLALGFAQRFLAAGWSVDETAWLFDLAPEALS